MFVRFVVWPIVIAIGALFVIKTEVFFRMFGRISWAEQHLGTEGGSRLMYKLIGMLAIIIGFMGITGSLSGFVVNVIGPLFGAR